MSDNAPSKPVDNPLAPDLPCNWFGDPAVRDLCQKTRGKPLSRDETLLLAIAAGQAALMHYIHPGSAHDAAATIDSILSVLDHDAVGAATFAKARELLSKRQGTYLESGPTLAAPMLQEALNDLYECEINAEVSVASFWDGGWHWRIKLGDELNGFQAEHTFSQEDFQREGALWLITAACKQHPEGTFAQRYAPRLLEEAKAAAAPEQKE